MLERIFTRSGPTVQRTGTWAIAAGLLLFASVFAEYLFSAENDGKVTNVPVLSLYIAGFVAGTAALILALNGLRLLKTVGSSSRRRRMLGWSTGIGLLLALTGAAGAYAGGPPIVQEKTAIVNEPETTTDVHPCSGQPAQWTIINNGTIHFTAFADGTVHFTGLLHLTLVIDLLDPVTGLPDGNPDATGTATDAFGGNGALNEDGTAFGKGEDSFSLNGRGTNADGSRFNFHLSGHHVFDSAGNAKLDLFRAHCA